MSLCRSLDILDLTSASIHQVQLEGLGEKYNFPLISILYNFTAAPSS